MERPKLAPVRDRMRARLAEALELDVGHVSVKATRGEGMGFVGREEGVAALAVATVRPSAASPRCAAARRRAARPPGSRIRSCSTSRESSRTVVRRCELTIGWAMRSASQPATPDPATPAASRISTGSVPPARSAGASGRAGRRR